MGSAVHVPSEHVVKSVHVLDVSVFDSQHTVPVMASFTCSSVASRVCVLELNLMCSCG